MKKYITTPIYYVNDKPHLGSAYTTIACDAWARFQRFLGNETFFLTGTDEHGQKIQRAAEKAEKDPKKFVDDVSLAFKNLCAELDISNNDFIRTSEERHIKAAQHFWNVIEDKGFIYKGKYEGWYSVRDEAFYQEDELVDGKAPTGAEVDWTTEESYFFKLSAFTEKLLSYYERHPNFIYPASRKNEVVSFVKSGLKDLSISRTSFNWGIPLPNDKGHIMYVWMDALVNYITAIGYPNNFSEDLLKQAVHVVGKDILKFHAVYWPAFLMAAELPLPKQIVAHGWWTVEGEKMSKSLGNTIDPIELCKEFGIDSVRNFVFREMPFGQDGNFSKASFLNRCNAELSNAYGNLVQRTLSFVHKNNQGKIPQKHKLLKQDKKILSSVNKITDALKSHMEKFEFHKYCEEVWKVIYACNAYIDIEKPWSLKKTNPERMATVLYVLSEAIRKIALITQPILPVGSKKILDQLCIKEEKRSIEHLDDELMPESNILEPSPIYPRFQTT